MHSSPRITTWLAGLAALVVLGERVSAQDLARQIREQAFAAVQSGQTRADYRAVQVRRVRGTFSGFDVDREWVSAVENLVHRGATQSRPEAFSLDLVCFEGISMSAADLQHRQRLYQGQAGYLFRFQSFRIHDAGAAAANYELFDVGVSVQRAGRRCGRYAIVSRSLDRPSWVIDVDAATNVPLYCGEFTPARELVSELEVLRIDYGIAAQVPEGDSWAWTPRVGIQHFATAAQALSQVPTLAALTPAIPGYAFDHARVVTDPLSGEQSVVMVHVDGIDSVLLRQRRQPRIDTDGHVLKVFADAGVTQCLFQQSETEFLLIGRSTLVRELAKAIYSQAVANL